MTPISQASMSIWSPKDLKTWPSLHGHGSSTVWTSKCGVMLWYVSIIASRLLYSSFTTGCWEYDTRHASNIFPLWWWEKASGSTSTVYDSQCAASGTWLPITLSRSTRVYAICEPIWLPSLPTISTTTSRLSPSSWPTDALQLWSGFATLAWASDIVSRCCCAPSCITCWLLLPLWHIHCWWKKAQRCNWVSAWKQIGWEFTGEDLGKRWKRGSIWQAWVEYIPCCSSEVLWGCESRGVGGRFIIILVLSLLW